MATYQEILSGLIGAHTGDLTPDRLTELASTAKTLASLGPTAPSVAPKAKADPKDAARTRLAELQANPLPAGSNDHQKCTRAAEIADLFATIHDMHGYTDANGYSVFTSRRGGDAA